MATLWRDHRHEVETVSVTGGLQPVEKNVAQAARLCFPTRNTSRRAAYSTFFNKRLTLPVEGSHKVAVIAPRDEPCQFGSH